MCEFKSVPNSFGTLSIVLYISAFILILLNMIFSCVNPQKFNAFKYIELIDYKEPIDNSFLMDLNFGSDLIDSDDYGSLGSLKEVCYLGKCVINSTRKENYNCSYACLNQIDNCYNGENLCQT